MFAFLQHRASRWFLILCTLFCLFPWHERLSSVGIIVLCLHTLIDSGLREKIKQFHFNRVSLWALLFFVWHLVATLWTKDAVAASQSIEVKLGLLILPLVLGLENHWNATFRTWLTLAFSASLMLAFGYLLVHAQLYAGHLPLSVRWQRMYFAEPLMNPGYISNYYVGGIVLLATEKACWTNLKRKLLTSMAILILLWAVFIFIAKIGVLFLLLFAAFLFLKALKQRLRKAWQFWLVALPGLAFMAWGVTILPPVAKRLQETENQLAVVKPADINITNSTMSRKVAYRLEAELLQQASFLGFGTGMSNAKVLNALDEGGYSQLVSAKMHVHNQWMNTGIALGWVGLILLVLFVVESLSFSIRNGNLPETAMLVLMVFNMSIEDLFEIQAGIVFFLFWVFLGAFSSTTKQTEKLH